MSLRDLTVPHLLPLWLVGAYTVYYVAANYPRMGLLAADSHAYWLAARQPLLYVLPPGAHDAYLYSPAFVQVIFPLAALPWPLFAGVWMLIETAAFAWLFKPMGWRLAVPLTLLCSIEIGVGNIYGLLAVALVLAFRYPEAGAFPLLTKITPAVACVWFAARGEWRKLGRSVIATLAIIAISTVFWPHAWQAWVRYLFHWRGSDPTVVFHVTAGYVLAIVAARRSTPWLLAPATLLACPVIHGWLPIVVLAAIPRLRDSSSLGGSSSRSEVRS